MTVLLKRMRIEVRQAPRRLREDADYARTFVIGQGGES